MGAALLPRAVLATFPEARRLGIHALPEGRNRFVTPPRLALAGRTPRIAALAEILAGA